MKHMNFPALTLAAVCLTSVASSQPIWDRQSPFPTDRNPKGVFALNATKAFFAGDDSMIVETPDAGATWNVLSLSYYGADVYRAVYFPSPSVGIITGNNTCLRSTDGGATWSPVPFFGGSWSHLDFVSASVGFSGANGALAATTDGGASWEIRSGHPACPVIYGMDFLDENVGLAAGNTAGTSQFGVFKTTDGGRSWTLKLGERASDVLWISSTRALMSNSEQDVWESLDSGETWQVVAGGMDTGIACLTRAGGSNIVIGVSLKGDVWRSPDLGLTWSKMFDGLGDFPGKWEASFADASHGWIVGPGGFYYMTQDGGLTWQQKSSGCNPQLTDIQMFDASYGLAIGHNGYMFRTTNGGAFWDVQKLEVTGQIWGRDEDLTVLDIVDRDFAVVAGPGGTVFKTNDGGDTWTSIGYPVLSGLLWIYSVDFIDRNLGYVYGYDYGQQHTKTLFRTRDGGNSWEWVDLGERGGGSSVQFVDAERGWLTSYIQFGLRTSDGGLTWQEFNMPGHWTDIYLTTVRFWNRDIGWAAGWFGYLAKTTDGGATWTKIELNAPDDSLLDVVPVSETEVWIGGVGYNGNDGFVFHTTDGGQAWARKIVSVNSYFYPNAISVLPSGDAWYAGFAGSIFHKPPTSAIVEPTQFALAPGILIGGGLSDLFQSDDQYLVAGPQHNISRKHDPITLQIEGTAQTSNPSVLEFILESRVTSDVQLKVDLWNFAQSAWETVHASAAPSADTTVTISASAPLSRFIEPSSRKMKARIRWRPAPNVSRSWRAYVDRAVWRITP